VTQKIWELHASLTGGGITTTPEGDAEVAGGLILSEKAYLLAVRDFRPQKLISMVEENGAASVAGLLVTHYGKPEAVAASGGRSLVLARGNAPVPIVRRSDEMPAGPEKSGAP
jgi:hypothetical protein